VVGLVWRMRSGGRGPSDPAHDVFIDDSFRVIRPSTGRNDTDGRDFCADLVQFTS
jgi:hypothetical protein